MEKERKNILMINIDQSKHTSASNKMNWEDENKAKSFNDKVAVERIELSEVYSQEEKTSTAVSCQQGFQGTNENSQLENSLPVHTVCKLENSQVIVSFNLH